MGEDFNQIYFSHDINPTDDFNLLRVVSDYGWYGYGVFWRLIELLHKNNNRLLKDEVSGIAKMFNFDEKIFNSILNDFGLFNLEDGLYSSARVGRNLAQMQDKRIQKQNAINKRWAIQKEKETISEYYKEEYKKVFGELPTLQKEEVSILWDIYKENEDFKDKLPTVFKNLSKIEFDGKIKFQPFSSWLLEKNHYSKVANGEFSKKKIAEIKQSLYTDYKQEYKELSEEEKTEIEKMMKETREKLSKRSIKIDEVKNGAG